jgi:hypothetical protein
MNFADIRFWGLLAAGLTLIAVLRVLVKARMGEARMGAYDRPALMAQGLF